MCSQGKRKKRKCTKQKLQHLDWFTLNIGWRREDLISCKWWACHCWGFLVGFDYCCTHSLCN